MEEEDRLLQGIEKQKRQLKRLQKEKDIRVAKAIISTLNPETASFKPKETKTPVSHFQSPANQHGNSTSDQTSLVQALQASLVLGRLPLPEPSVFDGNPLSYTEWKASFLTLVGSRPITPQEKFFYLKKYAGVEASKVIQGFFLNHTEESYNSAWTALESRYGNPFMLQRAYRDKLTNWPTIGARDSEALREYSDFLQSCQAAMEHVPGLNALHDCIENQKMVAKLPHWAADRWNRKVTKSTELGQYPDFHAFVSFVVGEANIACNPITSSLALSENKPKKEGQGPREPKRKAVNTLATTGKPQENKAQEQTKTCPFCDAKDHYLPNCSAFNSKGLEEKRKFVMDQKRCFGCLRTGHSSKLCQNKHTCQRCKGRHPTCLHDSNFVPKAIQPTAENATKATGSSAATLNTTEFQSEPSNHIHRGARVGFH